MIDTVEATQVTALQTGTIEWNQPARQTYEPGQSLPVAIRVTNPTAGDRVYQLYLGLYDPGTGQLIEGTLVLIPVDEKESFTVPAQSSVDMEGSIALDRTNVILALSLWDVAADALAGQVATQLEGPEAPAPPGTGLEAIIPIMGLGLVMGMMMPMMRMFREEE